MADLHTPEQIETWARESGVLNFTTQRAGVFARFAALVAQHERERCVGLCGQVAASFGGVAEGPMATEHGKLVHEAMAAGAMNCAAAISNSDGG